MKLRHVLTIVVVSGMLYGCEEYKGCHTNTRNLHKQTEVSDIPPVVPVPSSILLAGLGVGLVNSIKRKFDAHR